MRRNNVFAALVLVCAVLSIPLGIAQTTSTSSLPAWLTAAWEQAQSVPLLPTILTGNIPASFPQNTTTLDVNGQTTTYFAGGAQTTAGNPFFTVLGTNGRTCFTCHQPQNNWSITPATVLVNYVATRGKDPLFAPIDGADCPDRGSATGATTFGLKFITARIQLFTKANIRIALPPPASPQWISMTVTSDPTGCELSSLYGINNYSNPMLSFYRRALPATNVIYTTPGIVGPTPNIMWDTREPSLASQFVDATLTHAQFANNPTTLAALQALAPQGVAFQSGSFTAQSYDFVAGDLTGGDGSGAMGGGQNLYAYSDSVPFTGGGFAAFGGGSCSVKAQPCPGSLFPETAATGVAGDFSETDNLLFGGIGFSAPTTGTAGQIARRESIARGEVLFNTFEFPITGVTGLNGLGGGGPVPGGGGAITGTCSRCHNNANVGNDSFDDPKHLGIGDNTVSSNSPLQAFAGGVNPLPLTPDQPVFTFLCPLNSITFFSNPVLGPDGVTYYDQYQTSDPGVGWITGKCADLGKFKVSSLRGIGARPPFFHGGQAATMRQVILFYNARFSMNLTEQQIEDLTNFMNAQ
jgi:cytochrome c peroxidase